MAAMQLVQDPAYVLPMLKVVPFAGQMWCRSNRRLLAYRGANREELVEGVHWSMHEPDLHFFEGLSLEALHLIGASIRVSSLQISRTIMEEFVAATERRRARAMRAAARDV